MLDTQSSVIQLSSAPIEVVRNTINICFSIYIGTDWVRLTFFSKNRMHRVLELEVEQTYNGCAMF